jgi:hypothetical protein
VLVQSVQAMTKCIVRADKIIDDIQATITDPIAVLKRAGRVLTTAKYNDPLSSTELESVALCTVVAAAEVHAVSPGLEQERSGGCCGSEFAMVLCVVWGGRT